MIFYNKKQINENKYFLIYDYIVFLIFIIFFSFIIFNIYELNLIIEIIFSHKKTNKKKRHRLYF